ncbi:hypothetical protein T440DRAFT_463253 [Plenodomus tracheiphilus IPT5]|uniref:Ankyrin n=1 Tax=Plenodomus tracheiphilus IPT5 TaxID=1408161 RepID=A0A6A7BK61_9PLEO|nr:hypothetical protein T440DRAFT_463253 [Plenodomus tracheiphilus IPT5]
MNILNLPLELFHEILFKAVRLRGLKRGLRLRLVNRVFARETLQALLITRYVDAHLERIQCEPNIPLPSFAAEYLEHRVRSEHKNENPALLRIREVAEQLSLEGSEEKTIQDYIHDLCPFVLSLRGYRSSAVWGRAVWHAERNDLAADVLIAALYTKTMPIVEKWIENGRGLPRECSDLFGWPQHLAAGLGNQRLLATIMVLEGVHYGHAFSSARYTLLCAVAELGDAEAVRFVYNYNVEDYPWHMYDAKYPHYARGSERTLEGVETPSREVFRFLQKKRKLHGVSDTLERRHYSTLLKHCASRGWTDMASCYLDLGACVDGPSVADVERPLVCASKEGHGDIVRLVLWHGAKTCPLAMEVAAENGHLAVIQVLLHHGTEPGDAVQKAAGKGYWNIVLELMRHGVVTETDLHRCLVHTVRAEHEGMFRLLLAYGATLEEESLKRTCVEAGETEELESMLELISETEKNEREGKRHRLIVV